MIANYVIRFSLFLITVALLFSSCRKEEELPLEIVQADLLGEWSVASFRKSGKDQTAGLAGYSYEFFSNGDIVVKKGGKIDSFGSYQVNTSDRLFTVVISAPNEPSGAISDSWKVYKKSAGSITIRNLSTDPGKEYVLTKH